MGDLGMFDTLRYNTKLKEAGFTDEQAEVVLKSWMELMEFRFSTKTDVLELRHEMEKGFLYMRNEFEKIDQRFISIDKKFKKIDETFDEIKKELLGLNELKSLEYKLTIKLGVIVVMALGAFSAIVKLL